LTENMKKEALLYEKMEGSVVNCFLCAHRCRIGENKFGFCNVRQNIAGVLYTRAWGNLCAIHVDPVEKKPLYHFLPGTTSLSIAAAGCNFRCGFCQNWQISQVAPPESDSNKGDVLPGEIVKTALDNGCKSISYTYTEPTIFFEYAYETAKYAKEAGLKNIFVTNGYMSEECLQMIQPFLDAANVDLKFFKESSYRKVCSGSLQPVLDSIKRMKDSGIWVEVTTLVITGENDSPQELSEIAKFLAGLDREIPWHVSRFHPDYKYMNRKATDESLLKEAERIGREAGLTYIYAGNVRGWGNDTHCPFCGKTLIKRDIFEVLDYNIKNSCCAFCKKSISGIFE